MDNFIFDKTDKGREEIVTRKYRLASRLRTLLVLIDGKKSTQDLLQKVAGLGLDKQSLAELVDGEYIEGVAILPETEQEHLIAVAAMEATLAQDAISYAESAEKTDDAPGKAGLISPESALALQKFFNETIRSVIGLRGFTLQLKAEQAHTLEEFRALREPYLAGVRKSKGEEMMISLGDRLDQLLHEAEQSIR
ncbi:MAG: hypothetical protein RL748_3006 [Pseudomonadota bacterium]|jgi:hypothetical protein